MKPEMSSNSKAFKSEKSVWSLPQLMNRYLHVSQKVSLEDRDIPLGNTGNPASQVKPEIFMTTSTMCVRIRGGGSN